VAVELGAGDQREVVSSVVLLPEVGVSVISDIDDTIKVSEVRDRRALLVNTFFRPYLAVEGMARLYATWMERYGVTVHYLSGSPWPLYEALSSFTAQAGFPEGTWHLRDFAWDRDVLADLMAAPADYKRRELDRFATRWPKRRLILVGDSGEQDPEIYGAFSRANPGRVLGILIRDVTGEGSGSARYAEAFHDLPEGRWHVFRQSNALPVKVDPWFKENRRD
jgi:phosphatidate phosphatase APP1